MEADIVPEHSQEKGSSQKKETTITFELIYDIFR